MMDMRDVAILFVARILTAKMGSPPSRGKDRNVANGTDDFRISCSVLSAHRIRSRGFVIPTGNGAITAVL